MSAAMGNSIGRLQNALPRISPQRRSNGEVPPKTMTDMSHNIKPKTADELSREGAPSSIVAAAKRAEAK
jgi:hypothetical protein